jgi:WLM domain
MLHELAHQVRGPHDAIFYKAWDDLRAECEMLIVQGISGNPMKYGGSENSMNIGGIATAGRFGGILNIPGISVTVPRNRTLYDNKKSSNTSSLPTNVVTTSNYSPYMESPSDLSTNTIAAIKNAVSEIKKRTGRGKGKGYVLGSSSSSSSSSFAIARNRNSKRPLTITTFFPPSILPNRRGLVKSEGDSTFLSPMQLKREILAAAAERRLIDDSECANGWVVPTDEKHKSPIRKQSKKNELVDQRKTIEVLEDAEGTQVDVPIPSIESSQPKDGGDDNYYTILDEDELEIVENESDSEIQILSPVKPTIKDDQKRKVDGTRKNRNVKVVNEVIELDLLESPNKSPKTVTTKVSKSTSPRPRQGPGVSSQKDTQKDEQLALQLAAQQVAELERENIKRQQTIIALGGFDPYKAHVSSGSNAVARIHLAK